VTADAEVWRRRRADASSRVRRERRLKLENTPRPRGRSEREFVHSEGGDRIVRRDVRTFPLLIALELHGDAETRAPLLIRLARQRLESIIARQSELLFSAAHEPTHITPHKRKQHEREREREAAHRAHGGRRRRRRLSSAREKILPRTLIQPFRRERLWKRHARSTLCEFHAFGSEHAEIIRCPATISQASGVTTEQSSTGVHGQSHDAVLALALRRTVRLWRMLVFRHRSRRATPPRVAKSTRDGRWRARVPVDPSCPGQRPRRTRDVGA